MKKTEEKVKAHMISNNKQLLNKSSNRNTDIEKTEKLQDENHQYLTPGDFTA